MIFSAPSLMGKPADLHITQVSEQLTQYILHFTQVHAGRGFAFLLFFMLPSENKKRETAVLMRSLPTLNFIQFCAFFQ
jgi:hypothetical protein